MARQYFRPIPTVAPTADAQRIAGGWVFCDAVEVLERGRAPRQIPLSDVPSDIADRLTAARPPLAGLDLSAPRIMGILNTTPDSFSDGGLFDAHQDACAQARAMVGAGADMVDIGGESTRPGAKEVPVCEEIARTVPVIEALRAEGMRTPISIDTRKADVAKAALEAGADLINDVSAFGFDPGMQEVALAYAAPACLMHAQGRPETMQDDPRYDSVLLDVFDALEARVDALEAAGLPRTQVLVDPGIGFGKTLEHNLAILRGLSLFHTLGCGVLLGASRKSFIGNLSGTPMARDRVSGSVAVGLFAVSQGVQVLRVHDVEETRQALALWAHLIAAG